EKKDSFELLFHMKITAYWERSEEKRREYQQQLAEHSKREFLEMPISEPALFQGGVTRNWRRNIGK
ncbi:hypothetical protein, partial [Paenibacillus apiarius]